MPHALMVDLYHHKEKCLPVEMRGTPMSLADELSKLQELHRTGSLTDEEFTQAKTILLKPHTEDGPLPVAESQFRDWRIDAWMKYQIVIAIVALIAGALVLIWLPFLHSL